MSTSYKSRKYNLLTATFLSPHLTPSLTASHLPTLTSPSSDLSFPLTASHSSVTSSSYLRLFRISPSPPPTFPHRTLPLSSDFPPPPTSPPKGKENARDLQTFNYQRINTFLTSNICKGEIIHNPSCQQVINHRAKCGTKMGLPVEIGSSQPGTKKGNPVSREGRKDIKRE